MTKTMKERMYHKMIRMIPTRWLNSWEKYQSLNEPHDEYFYERQPKKNQKDELPF